MPIWKRFVFFFFPILLIGGFLISSEYVQAQTPLTSCSFSPSSIVSSDHDRIATFYWAWNGSSSVTSNVTCTFHHSSVFSPPFSLGTFSGKGATGIVLPSISDGYAGHVSCRVNNAECPTTLSVVAEDYNAPPEPPPGDGGGDDDTPGPGNPTTVGCSAINCRNTSCYAGEVSVPVCKAAVCDKYGGERPLPCALASVVEQCGDTLTIGSQCKSSASACPSGTSSNSACAKQFCPSGQVFCKSNTASSCPGLSSHCVASGACSTGSNQNCASACAALDPNKPVYCNNPSSCTGTDSSGVSRTGTCSSSSTCSSGTALSKVSGCTGGNACCYSGGGGGGGGASENCENVSGQTCSADCSKESGFEAGGTGTCSDTSKPQCCKSVSDPNAGTTAMCSGASNPGVVPCGRSCDNPNTPNDETSICTICHLFLLLKNIFDWIFRVMTYIAFAVLVAMGILYIVSAGNTQLISMAKKGIWAALMGFGIVLLGWVGVNVILMVLADGTLGSGTAAFSLKTNGSWFEFQCSTKTKYTGTGGTNGSSNSGSGTTPGGGSGPGNGSCSVISSGYCTTDSLGKACSWNAEAASKVCNVESGGNTSAASNTDRCQDENGDRFSFGLFQLNIIANGCMLGNDCCWQNVFTLENGSAGNNGGKKKTCTNSKGVSYVCGWGCSVKDRTKYTECSQRAMDAVKNIEAACTLYKQSGWSPWPVTKKRCGL